MKKSISVLVVITFIAMIVVNALANLLPINGVDTGGVSDAYQNLFAPAALTFAIWGLIYLLLAGFTFYQLGIINKNDSINKALLNKVGIVFSISSIANALWIFSWHYKIIYLSMGLMAIILVCLIIIVNAIRKENLTNQLTNKEKVFVKLPFSIYFGWITVATIANMTTLLVGIGWNGFGISETIWTVIVIAVGAVIGILTIMRNKDYAYGLVIIWAYIGILIKHMSSSGFAGMYPAVITTVIIALALVVVADVFTIVKKAH